MYGKYNLIKFKKLMKNGYIAKFTEKFELQFTLKSKNRYSVKSNNKKWDKMNLRKMGKNRKITSDFLDEIHDFIHNNRNFWVELPIF
jgi:hypothetical protein